MHAKKIILLYFTISVSIDREENTVHVGDATEFRCHGPVGSTNRQYMINSTRYESLNLTDVTLDGDRILLFSNIRLSYNGTTVQCTVTAPNGEQQSSTVGTLLVQGNKSLLHSMYLSSSHYRVVGCCF